MERSTDQGVILVFFFNVDRAGDGCGARFQSPLCNHRPEFNRAGCPMGLGKEIQMDLVITWAAYIENNIIFYFARAKSQARPFGTECRITVTMHFRSSQLCVE